MKNAPQDQLHKLLCAYVLGEADADQTARVEAALAESSELREERERLEQTLGVVRGAFVGEDALSDEALGDLIDKAGAGTGPRPAAETVRPRFQLLRSPALRAAAAVMLVAGGAWVATRSGAESASLEQVAMAPAAQSELEAIGYTTGAIESLSQLGYPDGEVQSEMDAESPSLRRMGDASLSEEVVDAGEAMGRRQQGAPPATPMLDAIGYAKNDGDERLKQLGYVRGEALESLGYADDSEARDDVASSSGLGKAFEQKAESLKALGYGGGESVADQNARSNNARERAVAESGQADRYLGPPVAVAPSPETRKEVLRAEASPSPKRGIVAGSQARPERPAELLFDGPSDKAQKPSGTYRGSGDTVPPGGVRQGEGASAGLLGLGYSGADGDFRGDSERFFGGQQDSVTTRERWNRRLSDCYRRPNERPRDMYFRFWGDNAFELAELDAQSTFSVDVDTASYALARRYLNEGHLPERAQIRTEEFVNYFDADLAAPREGTFAIHTELAPSRFGGGSRSMLRVGLRGKVVPKNERDALALTFVIDTSGSMKTDQRLELVKHAVRLLVGELEARDRIAIVAYSNDARLVLPMTSASEAALIESALYPLAPNGSTNAEAGLKMGYALAKSALDGESHNRVLFLSDGVANVGQTDQDRIAADVRGLREQGIFLNTIGVGISNHNDTFLEQLANNGDGICDYVDSPKAARRAIVERFSGAFVPIASDVKIQVEFDPSRVFRYRLLGYENRAIADKDFRNDAVDAGEVGSGHQVVALYEIEHTPAGVNKSDEASKDGPLATVRVRYKEPKGTSADPLETPVSEISAVVNSSGARESFAQASPGFRRSAVVAQFAEVLRRSSHSWGDSYDDLFAEARQLSAELNDPDFDEFVGLIGRARQLGLSNAPYRTELELTLDEFRRLQILRAEVEELRRDVNGDLLQRLQEQNRALEDELRNLIDQEVDQNG